MSKKSTASNRLMIAVAMLTAAPSAYGSIYSFIENYGLQVAWQTDERIGITTGVESMGYTEQLCFWTSSVATAADNQRALYATGYKLKDATRYYSYCPYKWSANFSATNIPLSFDEQQQTCSNSTAHLATYDYSIAQAEPDNGACTLNYQHLTSILRITFALPQGIAEEENLTLRSNAERSNIATAATLNLTAIGSPSELTLADATGCIAIHLKGLTSANEYTAYVALPMADLSQEDITITLGDTPLATITGFNAKGGHLYNIDLTAASHAKAATALGAFPSAFATGAAVGNPLAVLPDITLDPDFVLEVQPQYLLGDVNDDGQVDMTDARLIVQHYLGTLPDGTHFNALAADVNQDDAITISDATAIVNTQR